MRKWRSRAQVDHDIASGMHPAHREGPEGALPPEDCAPHRARLCEFGTGMHHQVNFGLAVIRTLFDQLQSEPGMVAKAKDGWPEEFIGQVIQEVVTHEVGHTLGLRHNFKGSSWLPLSKINDPDKPAEAQSGSIMDYNPTNISPLGKPQGFWNMRTIGPYDYWAIEYGYTLKGDSASLGKIASRVAEHGLDYATDEDTTSSDPYVFRFDMSSDPIAYAERRLEIIQQLLNNLVERTVKPGQGYQRVRQTFDMALYEQMRACTIAARFVGGHHIRRDHKGDPKERPPVEPVEPAKQRRAIDLISRHIFSKEAFRFSPDTLKYLAAGRWMHWGSSDTSTDPEYPIHDRILQIQLWALFEVLNPRTLTLIGDAEMRVSEDQDALTIPELYNRLTEAIWTEANQAPEGTFTNRKPYIGSIRRNLQHEYVGELIHTALEGDGGTSPQAARKQAWLQLTKLKAKLDVYAGPTTSTKKQLDDYSLAHLLETRERIGRALEASYSRNGNSGGGGGFIILGRPSASE